MDTILSDIEVRILGSLIEKGFTTPEYYPLTLNSLTNACNQKSNRNPVVLYEETTVVRGLDGLREKKLAVMIQMAGSRVPKYQHLFGESLNLEKQEVAVLCELMLRGPQTTGEIRNRADRMYNFKDLEEVEEILQGLMEREESMVTKLPRQFGRKERRYMHLLSGMPEIKEEEEARHHVEAAVIQVQAENERIAKLEEEMGMLRKELDDLKQRFVNFKSQFE
jgi:uncharacterized protein YceH (UPF0502 family)